MKKDIGKNMLSASKFYMGYSRWIDAEQRNETWNESVERVMNMHREKYKSVMTLELESHIKFAEEAYKDKLVLGAQRALQFGGEQLFKHEARIYNCATSYADRPSFFNECMYLLLCGCGVGFSVQNHHINKLPLISSRSDEAVVFTVPDSIEGWADAFAVLLSSYFIRDAVYPEYKGKQIRFDFSEIRPKGAMISGGFKSPGSDGLRAALYKCEELLEGLLKGESQSTKITSIVAYDFVMHMSDAVLSGGVRRSATICIFDKNDQSMLTAKTGDWFTTNPQRARSNNSAMLVRDQLTQDEWDHIMQSVKGFGEPGFIFSDSTEFMFNPCVEIGMLPVTQRGESGFQFCNLTEINGGKCINVEIFYRACKAGAILGTLQAGYTNFKYVSEATKLITEHEALLGVSVTGWMNNPDILLDKNTMICGAKVVLQFNEKIAKLININQAARTTCVKPSGNASVLLETASGIHGDHSPMYFRNVQMNKEDEVTKLITLMNQDMVEDSVWSAAGTDSVVSFPIVAKEGSLYKSELLGIKQLEVVKLVQEYWVDPGTNIDLCRDKRLRNNVSNTITVDDWDEVSKYIFDNRAYFAGISLMSSSGDKAFMQAPFTEVITSKEIIEKYGDGGLLASGLIVDALHAFNDNLWQACDTAMGYGLKLSSHASHLLMRDWVRRAHKFSENYFDGDMNKMTFCLKDCYNLHKWKTIEKSITPINFSTQLLAKKYTDADTTGSEGCAGGACEIRF